VRIKVHLHLCIHFPYCSPFLSARKLLNILENILSTASCLHSLHSHYQYVLDKNSHQIVQCCIFSQFTNLLLYRLSLLFSLSLSIYKLAYLFKEQCIHHHQSATARKPQNNPLVLDGGAYVLASLRLQIFGLMVGTSLVLSQVTSCRLESLLLPYETITPRL
jgi:hypothetical protein